MQAETYINANNNTLSNNTLYVIYIGGNDYLAALAGLGDAPVQSVLNYTADAMEVLYDAGARMYAPFLDLSAVNSTAACQRHFLRHVLARSTESHNTIFKLTL